MTNDTNPDIVDKADALVGIADAIAGLPSYARRFDSLAQAIRVYACSLYGHRPQWGEAILPSLMSPDRLVVAYERTCQRCGRDLQPAERAKE